MKAYARRTKSTFIEKLLLVSFCWCQYRYPYSLVVELDTPCIWQERFRKISGMRLSDSHFLSLLCF